MKFNLNGIDVKQIANTVSIKCFYFTSVFMGLAALMVLGGTAQVNWAQVPSLYVMIISAAVFVITADDLMQQSGLNTIINICKFLFSCKSARAGE